MSLRWKRDEREKGLRAVVQGPRGAWLRDGETRLAHVSAIRTNNRDGGWYWVAGWDAIDRVPHKNTCNDPVQSLAEAKAQAMAYVKQCLATTQPKDANHVE